MAIIREFDRVTYTPIPGQPPTIVGAEIYRLDVGSENAFLVGFTSPLPFPLTHLTKFKGN